jgi:ADP-ribose pyrophosphatase
MYATRRLVAYRDEITLPDGRPGHYDWVRVPDLVRVVALAEETGYRGGRWTPRGAVHPMPGLTPARVHLWSAEGLTPGESALESGEADLKVRHVSLDEAVRAVHDGRIGCASSAALVLAVATTATGKGRRLGRIGAVVGGLRRRQVGDGGPAVLRTQYAAECE